MSIRGMTDFGESEKHGHCCITDLGKMTCLD